MTITTRQPTGLPHWPTILLAGKEGTGKSWACAEASASDMVGRTLWVSIGETDPDMYGAIPGARFEIVEHDRTTKGIKNVLWEIAKMPATNPPTLLVVDSMTKLWDQIKTDLQATAYRRAVAKARKYNKPMPDEEVQITMDLWNDGKERWASIVAAIMTHPGPVLLTARLDVVTVMDANGQPTKEKDVRVQAEKNLVFDVDTIVELEKRGRYKITKTKSTVLQIDPDAPISTDEWTAVGMWRKLGLDQAVGERHRTETADAPDPVLEEWRQRFANARRQGPDVFRDWGVWAHEQGAPQAVLDAIPAAQAKLDRMAAERAAQQAQQERPQDNVPESYGPEDYAQDVQTQDLVEANGGDTDAALFREEAQEPEHSGHTR